MKYSGLLRSLILIWFGYMNAMQVPNELKLHVLNMTDKIVAAYDQSEKYHDIFPTSAYRSLLWKPSFSLEADHHRSFKICAPAGVYTLLFVKQHYRNPIVQLCARNIGKMWHGDPIATNEPLQELTITDSNPISATISADGYVIVAKK